METTCWGSPPPERRRRQPPSAAEILVLEQVPAVGALHVHASARTRVSERLGSLGPACGAAWTRPLTAVDRVAGSVRVSVAHARSIRRVAATIMAGRCSCPSRSTLAGRRGGDAHTEYPVEVRDIFRTAMGKTIRVDETDDGALTVEVLRDGTWMRAPLGMIGLRLSPMTRRLTAREIDGLPA